MSPPPNDAGAHFNAVAGKLFQSGDYLNAARNYERAIAEGGPVATYFSNLAAVYLKLTRYSAAEEAARRALVLEPRLWKARYRRAMARKGLNSIPAALVDIAGVLTANPANAEARAAFDALVVLQTETGMRPLEAAQIVAFDMPHAYGSSSNPPLQNHADPHQLSLPCIRKIEVDEAAGHAALDPDLVVSACMTCKRTNDKKNLKTCKKCRRANYCNAECQRVDWPIHKLTCAIAIDKGKTIKLGRDIHHHQFFNLHLIFYALRTMGPPNPVGGKHEFLLMVNVDLVPTAAGSKKSKHITVKNLMPVPMCIIPADILAIHTRVVRETREGTLLHAIWITTTSIYGPGEEEASRIGLLVVNPWVAASVDKPFFSLDLYSHSYGLHRRVTPDLDFLFESINDELRLDVGNHYRMQM